MPTSSRSIYENFQWGSFRAPGHGALFPAAGKVSCCGAQNFCAASRRALEILTAATRSPRCIRHWRRSARFQKSREKPRFLHFLARYTACKTVTLYHTFAEVFSLPQRIKGLSPAAAPLPLMPSHGRGVCVHRAGGAEPRPCGMVTRGICVCRAGGCGLRGAKRNKCPWGTSSPTEHRKGYVLLPHGRAGSPAPTERYKGRVYTGGYKAPPLRSAAKNVCAHPYRNFIRKDFFRRELFLVSLQGKETESHGILDENHLYFVFILLHASL